MRGSTLGVLISLALSAPLAGDRSFVDATHESAVLGEARHYRIFLPVGYAQSNKRYPVIYYFHGHSDRYTLEAYDHGTDTVPKIADYVGSHDVIVVAPDGYVARDYTAFYAGTPYDVRRQGGDFDFGAYFVELSRHIDSTYRTLATRRFRATSGLSMGGFMSLYLSARYPDLIGSASAFNPGPEFYVGEKGRRSLWRPKDHVLDHEHTLVRLIRASGDYISQYHEETREAYARTPSVDFEFRQDEYHRHWATSIAETFDFHMRAFAIPELDNTPAVWNYSSAYARFSAHGYSVETSLAGPGIIYLEHVSGSGFGIRTRQWAPDGPSASCANVTIETAPRYQGGATYRVLDLQTTSLRSAASDVVADSRGRLHLRTDCAGHEFGIDGPLAVEHYPVILPITQSDYARVPPGKPVILPLRLFNPGALEQRSLHVEISSDYPTVEVLKGKWDIASLGAGGVADGSRAFQLRFTAGEGSYARARINVRISGEGLPVRNEYLDVLIQPENILQPLEMAVLDGRTMTFPVFRQRGNQGGGGSVTRTVTEGRGNGNGILEPGEQATIWVRVRQGLDPFDKNNWRRAKVYSASPWLAEVEDIQEEKQMEWTSAMNRTSLIEFSGETPRGSSIPIILDCEGWSYSYTPDVRFGRQPLYQAFQIHNHQLFAWTVTYP